MRVIHFFCAVIAVAMLLSVSHVALAQSAPLRGNVKLVGQDGQAAPVAGATIDVYRTDIKGEYHTTSGKNGDWQFAGLPLAGTYMVSISAPGGQPYARGGLRVLQEVPVNVVLQAGDGKRFTAEEAKAASAGDGGPRPGGSQSGSDKTKREEGDKQVAEEKTRVTNINEVLGRAFKAGNEAIVAKNYEEAIKQFDEGLAADPDQVVLYSRKAIALRLRGVDHYNASVKSTDQAVKTTEFESAKKDFQASADAASKGVEVAKKEAAGTDAATQTAQNSRKLEVMRERAESMRLFTKVDPSQADTGAIAYQEYMAVETDAAKKAGAQLALAQMLLDAGSADKAIVEFQKILDVEPDNVDALYGMGVAQINIGYAANDKAKLQEAVNYLQRFVDKAPDTNRYKLEAKATIDEMKKQQNVVPEKTTTPARRKRP